MNRDAKAAVIDEIAADISDSQAIFAIDYRGITVAQADQLRARLREADAVFRVVKNSLTERAAAKAGAEELLPLLQGPTALTFVRGDAAAAAKAVADFTRATQLMAFKGGLMDGATLSSADVTAISRLPSRDVLYGQLVGLIASPIAGLARTLNALIGGLAVGLGGVLAQKEADPAFAGSEVSGEDSGATEADSAGAESAAEATEEAAPSDETAATEEPPGEDAAETAADGAASDEVDAAGEPDAADEGGPSDVADAAGEEPGEADAADAEPSAPEAEAAVAPTDEPVADVGDVLDEDAGDAAPGAADDAPTEAEAAPIASDETQTDDSAPEAPSGDDDKEDQ
ncbi:MAG TPA: 50S ribosomal protein L10 [Solirubrobacteraceae bacterium]|nr:50S ribosomal protein L10 [Solirubrobacteraceae bacterium]